MLRSKKNITIGALIGLCCCQISWLWAQTEPLKIGDWRVYLPYRTGISVAQDAENVYWATGLSVLKMNKNDFSTEKIDKVNTLNGVSTRLVRYNKATQTLMVVYENAAIDLIRPGGAVVNLPDIANNLNIIGDKNIYDVSFSGDTAFLACGFGMVRLNMRRAEFLTTTFTKVKTTGVATLDNQVYITTENGLFSIINSPTVNISDFRNWTKGDTHQGFPANYTPQFPVVFNNKLYFTLNDTLKSLSNGQLTTAYHEPGLFIRYVTAEGPHLLLGLNYGTFQDGKIVKLNANHQASVVPRGCASPFPLYGVEDAQGRVWCADLYNGFRYLGSASAGLCNTFELNAPYSQESSDIVAVDTMVWVAYGGVNGINPRDMTDGFGVYNNGKWTNFNALYQPVLVDSNIIRDFYRVAINPLNQHVFVGSFQNGLVELSQNKIIKIYNQSNSAIRASVPDPTRQRVGGLAFDKKGHLWVANTIADRPVVVLKNNGQWQTMRATPADNLLSVKVDSLTGYKWFVVGGSQTGILVYDEGRTLEDLSDDRIRLFDNADLPRDLQTARINCVVPDLEGKVWVGTTSGVAYFDCFSGVFDSRCTGNLVVSALDGIGEYLLREKNVQAIAVDGANRKWFGTTSGIFVTSPDGGTELFKFNAENSPLLSNNITTLSINLKSGEVFIGTDKGLMSYQSEATEGRTFNSPEPLVYPNPVTPQYEGPIAISGLARDANVKITDMSGATVFETTALGGQAIWYGKDFNGRRVASGVYLVYATNTQNSDAPEAVVAKILFIH